MAAKDSYDPGPRIAHAGGINIGTPDLAKSLWFFRDILGMEVTAEGEGIAYLRGYQELTHHSLVLTQQAEATINTYSFRVQRREDVERFHEQLTAEAATEVAIIPAESEAGRGEAIRFLIPGGGHPVELYYDIDKPEAPKELQSKLKGNSSRRRGLGVQRIDHLNVMTDPNTVNQAEQWLQDALGFQRREFITIPKMGGMILASWLSVNSKLHDIAIGGSPTGESARFHHVAFHLENFHDVLTAVDQLRDLGIQVDAGPGKHGVGQAMYLYLRDPGSGHRIELYSGGYPFFDPDWEALEWQAGDELSMRWYGDLPDLNPATSPYVSSTASTSSLWLPAYGTTNAAV